jgi:ElaB/YqjD/DUF883 family membrane-anchored ribosome-binding protein
MNQRNNGIEGDSRRDPDEIRAEIDDARSAIAGDIRELGEKLSPDNLKAGAKHVIEEAKEGAKGAIRDVKDAAMDRMITAKDHAIDSLSETASEVSYRARRAGVATAGFMSANAVPLALIGIGAGWLTLTMRRQRRLREQGPYTIGYGDDRYYDRFYDPRLDLAAEQRWSESGFATESRNLMDRGRGTVDQLTDRAREGAQHMREGAHNMRDRVQNTVSDLGDRAHELGYQARELGYQARDRMMRAERRTVELAQENPLAVGAIALAAGVGIGLALPASQAENRLMGPARGRLVDQARTLAGEARSTAEQAAQKARQAVDEIKQSVTQPSAPR